MYLSIQSSPQPRLRIALHTHRSDVFTLLPPPYGRVWEAWLQTKHLCKVLTCPVSLLHSYGSFAIRICSSCRDRCYQVMSYRRHSDLLQWLVSSSIVTRTSAIYRVVNIDAPEAVNKTPFLRHTSHGGKMNRKITRALKCSAGSRES